MSAGRKACMQTCAWFVERGHDVTVFAASSPKTAVYLRLGSSVRRIRKIIVIQFLPSSLCSAFDPQSMT